MQQDSKIKNDLRLIEAGFPCHQVGAETQRERGASSALPPLYYLHVWWARRPLTPSRAAILASLLPAETDTDWFLRQLGIEKVQALVNGAPWVLVEERLLDRIKKDTDGREFLFIDDVVFRALKQEQEKRSANIDLIKKQKEVNRSLQIDHVLMRWEKESQPFEALPALGSLLPVHKICADAAWAKERIAWENSRGLRTKDNKYGYTRAFRIAPCEVMNVGELSTILDPTAGGGSIPYEALRLGHKVIANELNPVATVILYATLDYPLRYGVELSKEIELWGNKLRNKMVEEIGHLFPAAPLSNNQLVELIKHQQYCADISMGKKFGNEESDGYIYARQVICPHCEGDAPLLNSFWLSKEGEQWGVKVNTDGRKKKGTVSFETYRVKSGRGPQGEDPNGFTVVNGVGTCVHCQQAISSDEIKAQARGESPHGSWQDRLYCVVAVRYQPQLDSDGKPIFFKSGAKKGKIKTKKVRFFRPPNANDLAALQEAGKRLQANWDRWEKAGLIPTEKIPEGNDMRPINYGMTRWCDLFTPRQLLGHFYLVEELNRLKPQILAELGAERGKAVITYLQFAIDKGLDYNSKQTVWHTGRGVISHAFTRHDFSLKWCFGEMIFSGPNSGVVWGLSQVINAYKGIAELLEPLHQKYKGKPLPLRIINGSAANMDIPAGSVDLICMDPPYYNNVQYAELSDYFYVWMKRTLADLYPEFMQRRLTNKKDEAVANPARDGSNANAACEYKRLMQEIFAECRRVLKDEGLMTLMFTHKTTAAWEALTRSLIESNWVITSAMPVESEAAESMHQKGMATAASSVFITCRKREAKPSGEPAIWRSFAGDGVADLVRIAVRKGLREFDRLNLNAVDEMVAAYGRALWVLSEHWPVIDGDDLVTPTKAMLEASTVVAQHQFERLTSGRLKVEDLSPEAAAALTFYGIFNTGEFAYDQALNLSRALSLRLETKTAGYNQEGTLVGINNVVSAAGRVRRADSEPVYYAPLIKKGSSLRLTLPEERHQNRLDNPQTEWDLMQGVISAYRQGDIPLARAYLKKNAAGKEQTVLDLLAVWTAEALDDACRREGESILFGFSHGQ